MTHPFERGGMLSTTCARPGCLQAPTARIHRMTPDTPTVCPACGNDRSHDWWTVGDDSYGCDLLRETPDTPSTFVPVADDLDAGGFDGSDTPSTEQAKADARPWPYTSDRPDTPSTEAPCPCPASAVEVHYRSDHTTPSTEALTPDRRWPEGYDGAGDPPEDQWSRQEAADTSGPIIRAIQSDWRFQNLPDVPPDDATIARLRSIATGEAADTSGLLADLRAAVELADTRTDDGEVSPDGTVSEYVLSATDWNRIVAIARGSKSDAAERTIAPVRAALEGATERPRYSLEPFATDALVPDPKGEWIHVGPPDAR